MPTPAAKSLSPMTWLGFILVMGAGFFCRLFFISSHGAWDTEYRKAWATETVHSGIARAYGGPEAVPRGEFLPQLMGEKPRWEVPFRGRDFVIDYPPLALAVWGESWKFFTARPRPYRGDEAENLAVKFPPVLGDMLSVLVLLWIFRGHPRTAISLSAAYWIFPVTWVSSAVHGNFDGFVSPFLLVGLLLAGASPFLSGTVFAVACLIKPTVGVALPVLYLASPKTGWARLTAGGAMATTLVFAPFALAGTLDTAVVHIVRIFSQDRLSGGYANPWWLVGHAALVRRDLADWRDPIGYLPRNDIALPAGLIGFVGAALVGLWILHQSRRFTKPRTVAYVAALLLFVWGLLTVGVHDNHNHPLFLLLVASGLGSPFLRRFTTVLATSTLLGSVSLHGLGRFYGTQWTGILPFADSVARLRMAPGFDVTLILAVVNCALLVVALSRMKQTLRELDA